MQCQGQVAVQNKRCAIKYKLVLAANLIEIDERKARLVDPSNAVLHARVVLFCVKGRAI